MVTTHFFWFIPKIGEDEPILTSICFRWFGEKQLPTSFALDISISHRIFSRLIFSNLKKGKLVDCFSLTCVVFLFIGKVFFF